MTGRLLTQSLDTARERGLLKAICRQRAEVPEPLLPRGVEGNLTGLREYVEPRVVRITKSDEVEWPQRLQRAGKPTKAALIATARKLPVTLKAILATITDYSVAAAA